MRSAKRQSFSYRYSPHHKSVMSHGQKQHTPTSQKKRNLHSPVSATKKKPSSTSKSPEKQISKINIHKFQHFQNIAKFTFAKEKVKEIKDALEIQKKVRDKVAKRVKSNNCYINYDENPFMVKTNIQDSKPDREILKNYKKKKNTLLEKISALQEKKNFKNIKHRIDKLGQNFSSFKGKLQKEIKKQPTVYLQRLQMNSLQHAVPIQKHKDKENLEELQKIVSMKEDNFFEAKRNRQPFNLFMVLKDPKNQMFLSGGEQLDKYNFSFDSWITASNRSLNQNIYKHLAHYSRIAAVKNTSRHIPKEFRYQPAYLQVKFDALSFNELMLVASGQALPDSILQIDFNLGEKNDKDSKSSLSQAHQISYKKNHVNQQIKGREELQKIEAEIYLKKGFSEREEEIIRQQQKYRLQFSQIQASENKILKQNIYHKKTRRKTELQKQNIVREYLSSLHEERNGLKVEEKIKRNKMKKDKSEQLKLKQLIQVVKKMKKKDWATGQRN